LTNRSRVTDWLLLIAIPAFFFLWRLSSFGLIGADEPRYAQVAREMLERHDWVTPTLGGVPWLEKPPLYYWQAMLAYEMLGVSDWAARLPSVLDAFLLVMAVYGFLRKVRPGSELDGALITATSAEIVGFAHAASTDMPLTAAFAIAMLAWYSWSEDGGKKYLAGFYAALALATLAKGPVAPFLAIVLILCFAAAERDMKVLWRTLWAPGLLIFCAIGLPWYVLVQLRNPQFFHEFIIQHNLARFGTNLYHHPEPFWYYVPVTLLSWAPWSVFMLAAFFWLPRRGRTEKPDKLPSFLIIWIVTAIVFFSISKSKLPGYILPAIPAGAVLAADFLRKIWLNQELQRWARPVLSALHSAILGALLFCSFVIPSLILQHRIPWRAALVPLIVSIVVALAICVILIKSDFRAVRIATLFPLVVSLAFAIRFGAQPLDETLSARPVSKLLASFDRHHLPAAVFLTPRETEFGLAFYRNQKIQRYELGQVPEGEHLVVAAQGFERGVAKVTGRKVTRLAAFPPQRLELFYVPAR
jgi:4-amino-4-deoxy-L-arabinose transferase-like glycosyltransferase